MELEPECYLLDIGTQKIGTSNVSFKRHEHFNIPLYSAATVEQLVRERDELKSLRLDLQMGTQKLAAVEKERDEALAKRWINGTQCEFKVGKETYFGDPGAEILSLRQQLAAAEKERDAFQNQCIALKIKHHIDPNMGENAHLHHQTNKLAQDILILRKQVEDIKRMTVGEFLYWRGE